jgi:hypothetical protein
MILLVIALAVAVIVFVKGLIKPNIPSLNGDKIRFLKYLSCAYAMCIHGCKSYEVLDILLEEGKGCYDVCNDLGPGVGTKRRMCGTDYVLEFVWKDETTYTSNVNKSYWNGVRWERWILTDLMWNPNPNIRSLQSSDRCYATDLTQYPYVTLDGIEYRSGCKYWQTKYCVPFTDWCLVIGPQHIEGLCEGMLREGNGCGRPAPDGLEPYRDNTGHIWIDPNILINCNPFETSSYYSSCKFNPGDVVYIWTIKDEYSHILHGTHICPEFVICNNPPT